MLMLCSSSETPEDLTVPQIAERSARLCGLAMQAWKKGWLRGYVRARFVYLEGWAEAGD